MPPSEDAPVLYRSVKLRLAPFADDTPVRERVRKLEDHIVATAAMRGELAELRMSARVDLKRLQKEWDHLQGWEVYRGKETTVESVERAKTRMKPELYDQLQEARWIIARSSEEMVRMDADFDSCSRAYTLIAG